MSLYPQIILDIPSVHPLSPSLRTSTPDAPLSPFCSSIRWVEVRDVEEAMRLMHEATLKAATDPETGRLDLGNLDGSSREREARSYLANEVRTRGTVKKCM